MKKGQESWDGSARRRKGSGKTLLWPVDLQRGLMGKMERLLQRPVAPGHMAIALN